MGSIKVETGKLRSAATEFSNTSSQIRSIAQSMSDAVSGIADTDWQGFAAREYLQKFCTVLIELNSIDADVQEHVNDLLAMAQQYEMAEMQAKEKADSLLGNVF